MRSAVIATALLAMLGSAASAAAAPSDPVTTFSADGIDFQDIGGNTFDRASSVAAMPDGGVAVGGQSNSSIAIVRYRGDGTLDNGFSGDGKLILTINGNERAEALLGQPDGKLLVGGYTDNGLQDDIVLRYLPNGQPDPDWAGGGVATLDLVPGNPDVATVNALALQPDGKVVVAGSVENGSPDQDFFVGRFTNTGAPDTSFSGDGFERFDAGLGDADRAYAVALGPGGAIAAAGEAELNGGDWAVVRLDANGTPDTGFGPLGIRTFDFQAGDDDADGIAFTPNGKLIVSGMVEFATPVGDNFGDLAVMQIGADGAPDPAFGVGGRRTVDAANSHDGSAGSVRLPDGSIVIAGSFDPDPANPGNDGDLFTARLTPAGNLDPTWSGDGKQVLVPGQTRDNADAVALLPGRGVALVGEHDAGAASDDFLTALLSIEPDNCPDVADADQTDTDGDGIGDLCDANDDNDPLSDAVEAAIGSNPRSADSDGDGKGDGADACPTRAATTSDGCPADKPAPPPGPGTATGDTTAAKLSFSGLKSRVSRRSFLRSGLTGTITPNEAVSLQVQLVGRLRGTRVARPGDVVVAEKSFGRSAKARKFRLKASSAVRKRLGTKLSLQLRVVATDAAGNRTTVTRKVAVR